MIKVSIKTDISAEQFYREHVIASKPVILRGMMDSWAAMSEWGNPAYLEQKIGHHHAQVALSKKRSTINPEKGWENFRLVRMKLADFFNEISQKKTGLYYYLQNVPVETFPELLSDFSVPTLVDSAKRDIRLWIGSGENISPIHYDFNSNFLCQVRGTKRVVLFAPKESKNLYPMPIKSFSGNLSPIDFLNPNIDKYPRYKNIEYIECELHPGDMLFIPTFWWHFVETRSNEMTISLNFWWRAPVRQYLFSYIGLRTLGMVFLNQKKK